MKLSTNMNENAATLYANQFYAARDDNTWKDIYYASHEYFCRWNSSHAAHREMIRASSVQVFNRDNEN